VSEIASIGTTEATPQEQETVTEAVIDAVAREAGVSPLQLEPIASVVDPDALNGLFGDGRGGVRVEFEYSGYHVCLTDDLEVAVTPEDA
jgi:hypothetical protein